ncbi:MAG TPA: putative quinol monooxygenase [Terriglobales bacterium]|nr:putative quinol monooxygenase [Terriglobales bacterium]
MVVLAVTWVAKAGAEEKAAALFRELTEKSRREPGCAMYIVHRKQDDPRTFFIYEQYRDQAALEAHRASAHFQDIARGSLLEVAERKEGALYLPLEQ